MLPEILFKPFRLLYTFFKTLFITNLKLITL